MPAHATCGSPSFHPLAGIWALLIPAPRSLPWLVRAHGQPRYLLTSVPGAFPIGAGLQFVTLNRAVPRCRDILPLL